MKIQLLIASVALGMCAGLSIHREQRKFIYQEGYPSVRRYPVYPDRHSSLEQALPSVLRDIKNELEEETDVPLPTEAPGRPQADIGLPEIPRDNEAPSTDISLSLESESTSTTPVPVTTPEASFFESSGVFDTAPLLPSGFSFTPKPISVLEESPSSQLSPENDFFSSAPSVDDGSAFASGFPDSFFSDADEGRREVFTAEDARPIDSVFPGFRVPAFPVALGGFSDTTEDSTDIPATTDTVNNFLIEEEEEAANLTMTAFEENLGAFSENVTDVPLLDQTATESEWNLVTQDFNPTEETEIF